MEIKNGVVTLEEVSGVEPYDFDNYMVYYDSSRTMIKIPVKTLLRLHSILQYQVEKEGLNFENWCHSTM